MTDIRGFWRRVWEGIGHVSVLAWLFDVLKVVAGPAMGLFTYFSAVGGLPRPYLITASVLSAGAAMWLINQLAAFFNRFRTGYAYGLAYKGPLIGFNPSQVSGALQLGLVVRNATDRPLRYVVKRLGVVVEGQTLTSPSFASMGGIISRGIERQFFFPAFKRAQIKQFIGKSGVEASLSCEILYGHPDGPNVRRLEIELALTLNLTSQEHFGIRDLILKENDMRP